MKAEPIKEWVKSFVHKYLDVSSAQEEVVAEYAMRTWRPLGDSVPYLQFLGAPGTGKTRALRIMQAICKNAICGDQFVSPSALMIMLDKVHPHTLILDDVQIDKAGEITKILNIGSVRGNGLLKMMPDDDAFVPVHYDVFGWKVLACTRQFRDPGLQSKCITVELTPKTLRGGIPTYLNDDFAKEAGLIWEALRAEFFFLR